jgi:hypothetical protein
LERVEGKCIDHFMSDALTVIRTRRAEIARAIELLRVEDEELATTEVVLQRLGGETGAVSRPGTELQAHRWARPRSQREFVLDVLANCDTPWLRTREIVKHAKGRWGVSLPETSLRPLLSVMKRQKLIVRQGRVVALRERAQQAPHQRRGQEM